MTSRSLTAAWTALPTSRLATLSMPDSGSTRPSRFRAQASGRRTGTVRRRTDVEAAPAGSGVHLVPGPGLRRHKSPCHHPIAMCRSSWRRSRPTTGACCSRTATPLASCSWCSHRPRLYERLVRSLLAAGFDGGVAVDACHLLAGTYVPAAVAEESEMGALLDAEQGKMGLRSAPWPAAGWRSPVAWRA